MTTDQSSERDQALRSVLVATAGAQARVRPRRNRWSIAIVTFAVAGALTGGAIATGAVSSADQANKVFRLGAAAQQQIATMGTLTGVPTVRDSGGTVRLPVGAAPTGATRVVLAVECFENSQIQAFVATDKTNIDCVVNEPRVVELTAPPTAPQTVSVRAGSGHRILAWVSWMRDRPVPAPSAQQKAEISDGAVSHEEYLAAYNRYAGCMAQAGFPMAPLYGSPPYVPYAISSAAANSGADQTCYAREFSLVDTAWQGTLSKTNLACLATVGIDGSKMSYTEQIDQLRQHGKAFESCQAEQH